MALPFASVSVVSRATAAAGFAPVLAAAGPRFRPVADLDVLLGGERPAAALVVNAARSHYPTALRLMEHGVPVLVEKPLALAAEEVAHLVRVAQARSLPLAPALQYRFCAYLPALAHAAAGAVGAVRGFRLEWRDPAGETRHGERKTYDAGVNLAEDVMPHAWAVLSTVLGGTAFEVRRCAIGRGGRQALFDLAFAGVDGTVSLERDGRDRRRFLELAGSAGRTVSLDYSSEPGRIAAAGETVSADPGWHDRPGPIEQQLRAFFDSLAIDAPSTADAAAAEGSVGLAVAAAALLRAEERAFLAQAGPDGTAEADLFYALRDVLAPALLAGGSVAPGDTTRLDTLTRRALPCLRQGGLAAAQAAAALQCA
jgi:predicted dehydrogenase